MAPSLAYYPPGASYGPRTLADFELVWLQTGSADWRAGQLCLRLCPGDLLLIPPGTRDDFRWDREVPTRHGYLHFRCNPGPVSAPLLCQGQAHGPIAGLLEFLTWLGEAQQPGWRERAAEVVTVIARVLTDGPLPQPARPEPAALSAALEYVRGQWAARMRPLPVRELAAAACVSPSYLSRVFRGEYGCGPGRALELVRLERARTILGRTNLTVTQVAGACGFPDPLYFSRRFRAVYRIAPSAYRDKGAPTVPAPMPRLHALARRLAPQ